MMVEQMKGRLLERKYKLLHHHVSAVAKAAAINKENIQFQQMEILCINRTRPRVCS